jgi:hypothetical protein
MTRSNLIRYTVFLPMKAKILQSKEKLKKLHKLKSKVTNREVIIFKKL